MQHEMTDMELSERVCKALGIEPLEWQVVIDGCVLAHHHRKKDIDEWLSHSRNDPEFASYRKRSVYPSILDWPGFGRVVERLAERHPESLLDLTHDPIYGYTCKLTIDGIPYERCFCKTLPRALALAVVAWEASRG